MENEVKAAEAEFDLLKYLNDYTDSAYAHCEKKYPERKWMFDIQKALWGGVYHAKEQGKPLILMGAAIPPEIIWAFDAVPLILDTIATRLASDPEHVGKYIDIGTKAVPATVCCIDTCALGTVLSGDIKVVPDAYIYGTIPCDSSRCVYPLIAHKMEQLGVPTMAIDTPWRKDEYGIQYIAEQYKDMITFLEKVLNKKMDWAKFAAVIMRSNEGAELFQKIGNMRKLKPCPAPSRLLVLNGMWVQMAGSQAMVDFLRAELDDTRNNLANGNYPVKEEKYRVTWLQDMIWSNVGLLDWFEKKHNAVVVMDTLGYDHSIYIDDPFDKEQIFLGLAKRQLDTPMLHASSGPATPYLETANRIVSEYSINMAMFIGHVGCKHTWACSKLVKDSIENRMGVPTLTLDLDAIDGRYKPDAEVKATIDEYIESLEAK